MKRRLLGLAVGLACAGHYAQAATDFHRLAWTDDPTSTITIGWRQVSGSSPYVTYGTSADGSGWATFANSAVEQKSFTHPDDSQPLVTQLARVTGLTADTAYYYQICDSEGCSDTEWFKTAPATPTDFTFVAGGDSRTNRTPRQDGNKLVAGIRPLFVMFNGDFTDDGNLSQWQEWLSDWQLTKSSDGRMYPIVATHGNHENDVIDMLSYVFGIPANGYYGLNVGGDMMRIYTLNTEAEPGVGYGEYSDQDASVWNAQRQWLASDSAAANVTWKVGNYHRPLRPHTSGKSEGKLRLTEWGPLFTSSGFELLVESDTHMAKYTFPIVYDTSAGSYESYKRDDDNGTMIIGEGSWGAPTRPTDDDKPWTMDSGSFWQFKLVHAAPNNLDIRTVRFGSEQEANAGVNIDTNSVTPLTQAQQDADAFAIPDGLPLWTPLSGETISLPVSGFAGAEIDNQHLVPAGSVWKYLDTGSAPDNWQTANFDDASWASAAAQFGYGDGDEVTTVDFGGDADNKHPTTYFRNSFTLGDPADVIKLTLRMVRDDGAVVYINGQEVLRSNMPDGEISSTTYASASAGGSAESKFFESPLYTDALQAGNNSIAVEVHQSSADSSDLSFDLDLVAVVSNIAAKAPTTLETTIAANPLSTTAIEVSWSDAESFAEVGYQLERKVADGTWQIVTWRIDADTTQYTDTMLDEGTSYSYRVRPFNASGLAPLSAEASTQTLSNPVPKIFSEDFETGTWGEITAYNAASNADWVLEQRDGNTYARNNGYGADVASDDWLLLPPLALAYYQDKTLSFDPAYNYGGPLLKVQYSLDYDAKVNSDPASASWTEIPACSDAISSGCWNEPSVGQHTFEPTTVDLDGIDGKAVTLAFQYLSTGTGGGEGRIWQVDNITVRGNYKAAQVVGNDLAAGLPANWQNHSAASNADWQLGTRAEVSGMIINGFGADAASNDWLIMPTAQLSADDLASLSFDYYQQYDGQVMSVRVSTDYVAGSDPSSANWSTLPIDLPALNDEWMTIGPVSLAGYSGNVTVAFVYQSTGTGPGDGAYIGISNVSLGSNLKGVLQQTTVDEEDFNQADSFGDFTTVSVASNLNWVVEEREGQMAAIMSGFGADSASDDWLISPKMQIMNWQNAQLQFELYWKYGGPELEVLISTNYDGKSDPSSDSFTWTKLALDQSADALPEATWTAYTLDVSTHTGDAYVAFRYTSTGTGGGEGRRWGVDNVALLSQYGEEGLKANFSLGETTHTTIEPVNFMATVSGGTAPYSYSWQFGDGGSSSDATTSHTYSTAGSYTVSLTVTDADSQTITVEKTDLVTIIQSTNPGVPEEQGTLRVATFNAYLNRTTEGQISKDMASGDDPQIKNVAEIIQRVRPDLLMLNEIDYVADGSAIDDFQTNYLSVSQNGAATISYPYRYLAESNTGIVTEFDLDNNGEVGSGGGDAYGFGEFYGQYAMVFLSQYPIDTANVRTFQKFLWKDMPNATLPADPDTNEAWYSAEELEAFRLSSKSHWDIPVDVDGQTIHVLAMHPTPPVFDGAEDRNGLRNHDEIRLFNDYVDPALADYIYDDQGVTGGLGENRRFVIVGDLNASDVEGDATNDPIGMLKANQLINAAGNPSSLGGVENAPGNDHAAYHTADWKMRADYVIPSSFGVAVEQTAVYWPARADVNYPLVGPGVKSSDHRLVWADLTLSGKAADDTAKEKFDDDGVFSAFGLDWLMLAICGLFIRRRYQA